MTKIKIEPTEVRFYRASEKPYGALSNLYRREIEFEGEKFATSEHAYQAGKARKPEVRKWLMEAPSPALLAMAAHGLYVWDINSDWSKIKFDRMKRVLQAKFTQHEDLKELLLSTGTARLVESATVNNAVNRLWGEVNGVGKNKLGELLMEVRAELAAAAAPVFNSLPQGTRPHVRVSEVELAAHESRLATLRKKSGGRCLWDPSPL